MYVITVHPTYESKGSILIEDPNNDMSNIFDVGLDNTKNFIENETEILRSRTTSVQAINFLMDLNQELHILRNKKIDNSFWGSLNSSTNIDHISNDSLIALFSDDLRKSMSVGNIRNTDLLEISIQSKNPEEASLLVNTIIEVYKNRDLNWATGEMQHLKSFLNDQHHITIGEVY